MADGVPKDGKPRMASSIRCIRFGKHLWRIIPNDFPYTRIAALHHMVVPKRHVKEDELSQEEWMEYNQLKHSYINDNYEFIIEPTNRKKSIPAHFHIHLIVAKG